MMYGLPGFLLTDIHLLEKQIRKYKPPVAAVADSSPCTEDFGCRYPDKVVGGAAACARLPPPGRFVLTAIVGIAGLIPTLTAIENNKYIACQ